MSSTDPRDALRALRDQFLRGSEARLERIAEGLRRLGGSAPDGDPVATLRTEFHGFSGLGGTYGFPRVSALGRDGEELCDAFAESKASGMSPGDRAVLEGILEEIRGELGLRRAESVPRVLLVSDDPTAAAAIASVLETAGYGVRVVGWDAELERELAGSRPGLVLVDPASGDSGDRPERSIADTGPIPILILGKHVARPFEPADLLTAVAAAFSSARAG